MKPTCVIFARGGSTRVPNKNIKQFYEKPIISYSIRTAIDSGLFDKVYVDSEDDNILSIASQFNALRSKRPNDLGRNDVSMAQLVDYFLQTEKGRNVKHLCILLATAPLLSRQTLSSAFLHYQRQCPRRAVISVCRFDYPVFRSLRLTFTRNRPEISFRWPEYEFVQSQQIEQLYHDAGQFYILNTQLFKKHKKIFLPGAEGFVLNRNQVCDIDTLEDWEEAEIKYEFLKRKKLL